MIYWWLGGVMLAAVWLWVFLSASRGIPSLPDLCAPTWDRPVSGDAGIPRLTVIVPARNEEAEVERSLRSLLQQDLATMEVIAVNDRSTDATGSILDRLAAEAGGRLGVLHVTELPQGWLGKTHAMHLAAQQAKGEWFLFTDADVRFRSDALRRALVTAEELAADHFVVFPTAEMHTMGERMIMAYMFATTPLILRAWKVHDPKARDAVGVGAFNMIRRSAYESTGGFNTLRTAVLDDLSLGFLAKRSGFRGRVAVGQGLVSLRWAVGAFGILGNFTKNGFAVMGFRWWLLILAILGTLVVHLGPWFGAIFAPGISRIPYVLAVAGICGMYFLMARRSGYHPLYAFTHPLAALLASGAFIYSAAAYVRHGGVMWRGTVYRVEEMH